MTSPNSDPTQPEKLDQNIYARVLRLFGPLVMSPNGCEVTASEADALYPLATDYEGWHDGQNPVVGRLRELKVRAGDVRAEVKIALWNSIAGQTPQSKLANTADGHKPQESSLEIATMNIDFGDDDPELQGGCLIRLYRQPEIYYDFSLDQVIRPEVDSVHGQNLIRLMEFLGLNSQFFTGERTSLGYFSPEDLESFGQGLGRLVSTQTNEINV